MTEDYGACYDREDIGEMRRVMGNEDKIGALWFKQSGGKEYFTGEVMLNGVLQKIVVFSNSYKESEKHPDWVIFKSKPREQR